MTRYHPLLVALHWLLALMILVALLLGGPLLAGLPNDDPQKLTGLAGHMVWGAVIGGLLIVRLAVRLRSQHPAKADAGHPLLNAGAQAAHWGLYLLAFAMVASGLGTALSAGLFGIAFGGNGLPLPSDLMDYAPRQAHGVIAKLILALIALHILGAGYHQFVRKDKLLGRMWFGKRRAPEGGTANR